MFLLLMNTTGLTETQTIITIVFSSFVDGVYACKKSF